MNRSFRLLWVSQTLANLADSLYIVSVVTMIYQITNSVTIASLYPLIRVGAKALSSFFSPYILDRVSYTRLLWIAELAQTLGLFLLAWSSQVWSGTTLVSIALLCVFFLSAITGCSLPVRNTIVTYLVPRDRLARANSLFATTDSIILLAGWSMGGILVARYGETPLLWATAFLVLLSTLALFFIQVPDQQEATVDQNRSDSSSLWESWRYLFHHPTLRTLTISEIFHSLGGAVWSGAIMLAFVQEVLGKGSEWWGYLNTSYFVGTILGGGIIWLIAKDLERRTPTYFLLGNIGIAVLLFLFSVLPNLWIALVISFLIGIPYQGTSVTQRTLLQKWSHPSLLAKVLAAFSSLSLSLYGISVLTLSWIADSKGPIATYLVSSLLAIGASVSAFFLYRKSATHNTKEQLPDDNQTNSSRVI